MRIPAIERKLLRELSRLKGQIVTIAFVVASGITSFVALLGTYEELGTALDAFYDQYRFAHVFAHLERAPESLSRRVEAIPGVETVQTRVSAEVVLPIEGMARPAYGRLLSLPTSGRPATNALHLREGHLPEEGAADEVLVLESFATANGLRPGQRLPAVMNGKLRDLRVVGIVLSPEFIYAIRPGAIADDPQRYAILWMERSALAAAFELDGAFNDVSLRMQPGASESQVIASLDRILLPYGGDGAYGRRNQVSSRILTGELTQLKALAGMVPVVFLAVSAFLIHLVLGRLISIQRPEIAALKAIGYTNREVARHYLLLVAVVLFPGALIGLLGGQILGHALLDLYASVFRFPDLQFRMSLWTVGTSLLVSATSAMLGALLAVRAAVRLPPAEAMRPPAPAVYRRSWFDRLGFDAVAGPSGMMIFREIRRRPLRTVLSSLGIAGAVGLLILGRFGLDSMEEYLEGILRREQRQDLAVAFARPMTTRVVGEMGRMPGVITAESVRAVPIRVRHEHRMRDSVLLGLPEHATLRRLIERDGQAVPLPADGVLVTKKLAELLGIRVGDRVDVQVREGARQTVHPVVAGLLDESMGLSMYARSEVVAGLAGDLGAVSSVLLRVDAGQLSGIEDRLRKSPYVIDVSDLTADIQRLRDMNGSIMDVWTLVSITLAASVILGVVYNNARIALAVRSRDLASLRVLGFSRGEISRVLIGGLAVEVALAIPIGLVLGRFWGQSFMASVDQEMFRWAVVIAPRTYLLATAVAVLAASTSALWVRRSLDRLDLIGVLKTRE